MPDKGGCGRRHGSVEHDRGTALPDLIYQVTQAGLALHLQAAGRLCIDLSVAVVYISNTRLRPAGCSKIKKLQKMQGQRKTQKVVSVRPREFLTVG